MANCYDCIVPPPVCPPPDGDNQGEEVLTGFACTPTPILVPASTEESIFESGSTVAPNILATDPPPQPPPPPSPPEASDSATQPVGKVVFQSTGANTPSRPVTQRPNTPSPQSRSTGANTPSFPYKTSELTSPAIIPRYHNNTPRSPYAPSVEGKARDNSPIFQSPNPVFDVYDRQYNYAIPTQPAVLRLATVRTNTSRTGDPNNIFDSITNLTLNSILDSDGGVSQYVPFNSITLGSYLYNNNFIKDALNSTTSQALSKVSTYNSTSLHINTYFLKGLLNAAATGNIKDYSIAFFNNLSSEGRGVFPNGIPTLSDIFTQRNTAYDLIEQKKISLNTKSYSNGFDQRKIQMLYFNPKDIDLTLKIVTTTGQDSGVRVASDGTIGITILDGTVEKVQTQNEFFNIPILRDGVYFPRKVALKSNRDKAYQIPLPSLSMIQGLLGGAIPMGTSCDSQPVIDYSVDLSVTGVNTSMENNVEVSGWRQTLPESILFTLEKDSITDLPSPNLELRKTEARYKMAWKSGDDDSGFDNAVRYYSGPRDSYYIDGDDPIAAYIMETDSTDTTERYATLTFNDLNVDLPDIVLPRRILSDFIIYFTNRVEYSPFQGRSTLDTYESGKPFKRSVKMVINPSTAVQRETYVKTTNSSDGLGVNGRQDARAINFAKSFIEGRKIQRLSKSGENFITQRSSLGKAITTIATINTNYDLSDGRYGKRLPSNDLFSFFNFKEFAHFIKISETIRQSLLSGSFFSTPITVYPLKNTDTEKTYLTSTRLKPGGSDAILTDQVQKTVPTVGYFPARVRNAQFEGSR
tara:strand:+ start:72 stop:2492 length:2421 start_codon:yes stop_codon:yes gene_type:complete